MTVLAQFFSNRLARLLHDYRTLELFGLISINVCYPNAERDGRNDRELLMILDLHHHLVEFLLAWICTTGFAIVNRFLFPKLHLLSRSYNIMTPVRLNYRMFAGVSSGVSCAVITF